VEVSVPCSPALMDREEQHDDQMLHELLRCVKALFTSEVRSRSRIELTSGWQVCFARIVPRAVPRACFLTFL
jgi:hypothetical protein